jgi:hypothetical protein
MLVSVYSSDGLGADMQAALLFEWKWSIIFEARAVVINMFRFTLKLLYYLTTKGMNNTKKIYMIWRLRACTVKEKNT